VFKKIAKGLIALLLLLLIIIGISIFYFFQNLDKFLSNLIEKKLGKPLTYKTLSISLKEISISNFEIPTILKVDSLKIKFSISELLKRKTIYKISAYNVVFNVDSFENNLKRDTAGLSSKSSFEKFEIRNIEFNEIHLIVNNLNINAQKIYSSIKSDGKAILIKLNAYNLSENKTIHQNLDSLNSQIKIYSDSIFTISDLYADSLRAEKLNFEFFPNEKVVILNSKFIKFKTFNFYNIISKIEIESLKLFSVGDSLTFESNRIYNFNVSLKFKNDTIFINEGKFNFLNGKILLSGFVFDTSFNINAKISKLKPDKVIEITGNFNIYGNFNSNLNITFSNTKVIYDTFNFENLSGTIYSKNYKNFEISKLIINDKNVVGEIVGSYNLEKQKGNLNLNLSYVNLGKFNNFIKGSCNFLGNLKIEKNHFEIFGDGNFSKLSYENYHLESGIYKIHLIDSFINFQTKLLSLKTNDSLILDSSYIFFKKYQDEGDFSIIAFSKYGKLNVFGNIILKDTIKSNFNFVFLNGDTIIKFEDGLFESYKNYNYLKARNENIIFELVLDSQNVDLTFISSNFNYEKLLKVFKIDSVRFDGYVALRIKGDLSNPKLFLNLDLNNAQFKKFLFNELYSSIYYYDKQINVDYFKISDKSGTFEGNLVLSSVLKLNPFSITLEEGNIGGEVSFNGFPVDIIEPFLFPNVVIDEGYIEGKAKISGSLISPSLSGNAKIHSKNLAFTPFEIEFKSLDGSLNFYKNTIKVNDFILNNSKSGILKINGFIVFSNKFKDINFDLTMEMSKFYFSLDDWTEFFISGFLKLSGKFPSLSIEGNLNIDQGYVNYPVGYKAKSQPEAPNPLRYYITITADRRIFFSNELVDAELSANLILQKTSDVGQYFEGSFNIIKGNVYLYTLNKNFKIIEGKINVVRNEINLDIIGEAEIYDDTITAHVMGTLENPYFELFSKKGRSQFEILNLVLSGGFSERGINLAQQVLTRNIRKKFNFDELTFIPIGNNALITLGSYITEKLYLKLSTDIQNPDAYNLRVQYFLKPNLSAFGERKENTYTIGIGYRLKF
jgi:hypothetical protein